MITELLLRRGVVSSFFWRSHLAKNQRRPNNPPERSRAVCIMSLLGYLQTWTPNRFHAVGFVVYVGLQALRWWRCARARALRVLGFGFSFLRDCKRIRDTARGSSSSGPGRAAVAKACRSGAVVFRRRAAALERALSLARTSRTAAATARRSYRALTAQRKAEAVPVAEEADKNK